MEEKSLPCGSATPSGSASIRCPAVGRTPDLPHPGESAAAVTPPEIFEDLHV
jgi:hypothetical protein